MAGLFGRRSRARPGHHVSHLQHTRSTPASRSVSNHEAAATIIAAATSYGVFLLSLDGRAMDLPPLRVRSCLLALAAMFLTRNIEAQSVLTVRATRVDSPPVLDGRDDDPAWRSTTPVTGFRMARPTEDGEPEQKTEFRVVYDPEYLYIFIRAYDTHPDSIIYATGTARPGPEQRQCHRHARPLPRSPDRLRVLGQPRRREDRRRHLQRWQRGRCLGCASGTSRPVSIARAGRPNTGFPSPSLRFAPAENLTFGFAVWRNVQRQHLPVHLAAVPAIADGLRLAVRGAHRPGDLASPQPGGDRTLPADPE